MPYNLEIENPLIFENDDFIIYSSPSLKILSERTFEELNSNKKRILDFFGLNEFRKVTVILLDDLDYFRKYVLSLRGPDGFLPAYARGVFDMGMIIEYINPSILEDAAKINSLSKNGVHEFTHIVNKEQIYKRRLTWLDEGIANNLDNINAPLNDEQNFKWFILNNILTIAELPILNTLEHKTNFKTDKYNGYDLVYLSVRYLIETMDKDEFQKMIRDYDLSIKIGETALQDAINYYTNKFDIHDNNKNTL